MIESTTSLTLSSYTSWLERLIAWNEVTQPDSTVTSITTTPYKPRNYAEEWFNRTSSGYVLKLFALIPYNAKASQMVWSPLALKLSLVALASLDPKQEANVYRFLFDMQVVPPVKASTVIEKTESSRDFNSRNLHPQTWSESVGYWWNVIVSTVLHWGYRHQTTSGDESAFLTSTLLSSNLKRSQLYEMCQVSRKKHSFTFTKLVVIF